MFNTVNRQPDREAVFWFLYTGFSLLAVGVLIDQFERRALPVPGLVTGILLVLTVVGAVVMPVSGIWLLVPPVVGLLFRDRRLKSSEAE